MDAAQFQELITHLSQIQDAISILGSFVGVVCGMLFFMWILTDLSR